MCVCVYIGKLLLHGGKLCSQHQSKFSLYVCFFLRGEKLFKWSRKSEWKWRNEHKFIGCFFSFFHRRELVAQQTTANEHMRALSTFYNFFDLFAFLLYILANVILMHTPQIFIFSWVIFEGYFYVNCLSMKTIEFTSLKSI